MSETTEITLSDPESKSSSQLFNKFIEVSRAKDIKYKYFKRIIHCKTSFVGCETLLPKRWKSALLWKALATEKSES